MGNLCIKTISTLAHDGDVVQKRRLENRTIIPESYMFSQFFSRHTLPDTDVQSPVPTAVVQQYGLDASFYKRYVDVLGIPIVASMNVPRQALVRAHAIIEDILKAWGTNAGKNPMAKALARHKIRIGIMAWNETKKEYTTDMPEHATLRPKEYWDKRARGLGATLERPLVSCAEENLLEYKHDGFEDRYAGENILVHEFGHSLFDFGIAMVSHGASQQLETIYRTAKSEGLWRGTYAATNSKEYWSECLQSYFDVNHSSTIDGVTVPGTRQGLLKYDARMHRFLEGLFDDSAEEAFQVNV